MERLSLEITKYDALIDNEPKEQNQLSFSVENIRTMEDWQDVATKISTLVLTLNGCNISHVDVKKSEAKCFSEALAVQIEKNKHKQRNP